MAAPKADAQQITSKLGKVGGMTIITHPVTAEKSAQEVPKPAFRAHFSVEGVNHPGKEQDRRIKRGARDGLTVLGPG